MIDKLKFQTVDKIDRDTFFSMVEKVTHTIEFIESSLKAYPTVREYECFSIFKRQKTIEFNRLFAACVTIGSTKYLEDSDLMDDIFSVYYTLVNLNHRTLSRYNITKRTSDYIYAFLLLHGDGQFMMFKGNVGTSFTHTKFVPVISDILSDCSEVSITLANNFIHLLPYVKHTIKLTLEAYVYIPEEVESEVLTLTTNIDKRINLVLFTEAGKAIAEYKQNFNYYVVNDNDTVVRLGGGTDDSWI